MEFQLQHQSFQCTGLISFSMDWLDLLAVQGTLKSLLQHHSSKASILLCSAFFTVQLSHPYMTTGKTIALTRRTFVSKGIVSDWLKKCLRKHLNIITWEIDGETVETVSDFIFLGSKSLQMVTAAMKLKDAYSSEKKFCPT